MNKGDLVNEVAQVLTTKKDAQAAVDRLLSAMAIALKKEDSIKLIGFGTFSVVEHAARKGRNPNTGEEMDIPAKKVVKFKASPNILGTGEDD